MKTYELNGNTFHELNSFYDEVIHELCPDFEGFGRNYDAFDDVLYGGFGTYEYEEPIELHWKNSNKSKYDLGTDYDTLVEIIKSHHHIDFIEA